MTVTPGFLASAREIIGDGGVLTGNDVRARAASWFSSGPCQAEAILRPRCTDELAALMLLCHTHGQAVVSVGGNTGVVDGATAQAGELLVSTERMTRIENVDTAGATLTVQAGVPVELVQRTAGEHGLQFPVDFGARGSATVGGAIATNAGGNGVLRYGMMREQVLGLEAVLADGTVVSSMNRLLKNNAGYDLKQLFIGSEGTLGIVTRAVLRLRSAAAGTLAALVAVENFPSVITLLRRLEREFHGSVSAFEVMWNDFVSALVQAAGSRTFPMNTAYPFYVLLECESGGRSSDVEYFESVLGTLLEESLICDAVIAQSESQRSALWAWRDDIEGIIAVLGSTINFDVSVPIVDADAYVAQVRAKLTARWRNRLQMVTFGHLGDGNIHFIVAVGGGDEADVKEVKSMIYEGLTALDGSVSAEHGIGLEKREFLKLCRSAEELKLMHMLKQSLDPQGLLNPGRVLG